MIVYLPYIIYFYHISRANAYLDHPKPLVYLALLAAYGTIVCHTISIWLTVTLACFRAIIGNLLLGTLSLHERDRRIVFADQSVLLFLQLIPILLLLLLLFF